MVLGLDKVVWVFRLNNGLLARNAKRDITRYADMEWIHDKSVGLEATRGTFALLSDIVSTEAWINLPVQLALLRQYLPSTRGTQAPLGIVHLGVLDQESEGGKPVLMP